MTKYGNKIISAKMNEYNEPLSCPFCGEEHSHYRGDVPMGCMEDDYYHPIFGDGGGDSFWETLFGDDHE